MHRGSIRSHGLFKEVPLFRRLLLLLVHFRGGIGPGKSRERVPIFRRHVRGAGYPSGHFTIESGFRQEGTWAYRSSARDKGGKEEVPEAMDRIRVRPIIQDDSRIIVTLRPH